MHREDVKAFLRKAFGSLGAFEAKANLKAGSVSDVLRGRASAPTERAIAAALHQKLHVLFPARYEAAEEGAASRFPDRSTQKRTVHRQSGRHV